MKATIFDIDGTLLQSDANDDALYLASVRDVLGDVSLRPSWGMYTQFTAAGILTEILNDNAIDATSQRVAAVRDRFIESVRRHVSEYGPFTEIPGARAFVQSLHHSTTHRIAYATGGWRESALLKLSRSGFPVTGVPLATCDDHFQRQEIMLHALRQLNGSFESVTYYGDGHCDAVAAKALGWQFVPVGAKLNGLSRYESSAT
ncbi:HAD family hydrolase [Microcoleus sp. FACHB-1515]|uniref:HAD family hydrolase n=1 Tax=Cyanophyceae TaxID=3028117 RepID=UPI001686F078|nr:HAD family hydrolase [Microcoleus sp. FACHB-1515]MBD2091323.1 HAD family hydrolase [Microcoleus sp. FACHB-1515]